MIELGEFALSLALNGPLVLAGLTGLATVALPFPLIGDDFHLAYVASYSAGDGWRSRRSARRLGDSPGPFDVRGSRTRDGRARDGRGAG